MYGTYKDRQASASRSQSAVTPCSPPSRRASAATPVRQSTAVPKTSNVSARMSVGPDITALAGCAGVSEPSDGGSLLSALFRLRSQLLLDRSRNQDSRV